MCVCTILKKILAFISLKTDFKENTTTYEDSERHVRFVFAIVSLFECYWVCQVCLRACRDEEICHSTGQRRERERKREKDSYLSILSFE